MMRKEPRKRDKPKNRYQLNLIARLHDAALSGRKINAGVDVPYQKESRLRNLESARLIMKALNARRKDFGHPAMTAEELVHRLQKYAKQEREWRNENKREKGKKTNEK